MNQVTIYVPEDEIRVIKHAARQSKCSVSEWVRDRVGVQVKQRWPGGYFDLFGSLKDETLRRPPQPMAQDDVRRENI